MALRARRHHHVGMPFEDHNTHRAIALARSALFLPATRLERLPKARASGADLVVIDLEDAVAESAKDSARDALAQLAGTLAEGAGSALLVRVNALATPHAAKDLALLKDLAVHMALGIMLPKLEHPDALAALPSRLPVLGLVESAAGLAVAHRLGARAGRPAELVRLAFGSIDYALDLGGLDPEDHDVLWHARSTLVWASRVSGLAAPLDGVTTRLDDGAALAADVARARRLGFAGKLCIHPSQIAAVHTGFVPGQAELAWAARVVAAAQDGAATRLDGTMVDRPVLLRAQRMLAQAAER
jgi:citrate lyase subunit beta / citryl-CoA lyase